MPELTGNAHLFLERKGMECGRTLGGGDETAELGDAELRVANGLRSRADIRFPQTPGLMPARLYLETVKVEDKVSAQTAAGRWTLGLGRETCQHKQIHSQQPQSTTQPPTNSPTGTPFLPG